MHKILFLLLGFISAVQAQNLNTPPVGMKWMASQRNFNLTWSKLQEGATRRGMQVLATVRHDNAGNRGRIRPTAVLSVSNRRLDARLLQCAQTLGLELPIRMLVWQSATGRVYIGYPDVDEMLERHQARTCAGSAGTALSHNLEAVARYAAH